MLWNDEILTRFIIGFDQVYVLYGHHLHALLEGIWVKLFSMPLVVHFLVKVFGAVFTVVDPAIVIHDVILLVDVVFQGLEVLGDASLKRIEAAFLVGLPEDSNVMVRLKGHHLVDEHLFEIKVFLFYLGEAPWVINLVIVDSSHVPPLHLRVVLVVVLDILGLKCLYHAF